MSERRGSSSVWESAKNNDQGSLIAEHIEIVKAATPLPLQVMSESNFAMLKKFDAVVPQWLKNATPEQREEARKRVEESIAAHTALNHVMAAVIKPHEFAEPLLKKAIHDKYGLELDVSQVQVNLSCKSDFHTSSVPAVTLLEAALHNCPEEKKQSFFFTPDCYTAGPGGKQVHVGLDVHEFINICRLLDLGKQYQAHIQAALKWDEPGAQEIVNTLFVNYQKAALKAASYIALCKGDIQPKHYKALMSTISGEKTVQVDGKTEWYRGLSFNDMPVHSCIIFEFADPDDESVLDDFFPTVDSYAKNDFIAYIPDDPDHPVKHYATVTELKDRLTKQFLRRTENFTSEAPSDYQQFFSRFMRYKDRSTFYYSFTEEVPTSSGKPRFWDHTRRRQKQDPDFLLQLRVLDPSGDPWAQHYDIWTTLHREFNQRIFQDARDAVVSNADADARDSDSLLAIFFEVGLAALNLLSFIIPPLGLVMLGVSAVQLMDELLEGVEELSKGDKEAGWDHITDVLENIGLGAAAIPLFSAIHSELVPVETPAGQKRLWRPDLEPYRSDVSLEGVAPDEQWQYRIQSTDYVQVDGAVFEKIVEPDTGQSRIPHPTRAQAYQPILEQDQAGEWRHPLGRAAKTAVPKPQGFNNKDFRRYAVKQSEVAGREPNAKGIITSADGGRFYIRNVDVKGKAAVYWVRSDFLMNSDVVDVIIVDPNTNRNQGQRLLQIAPDQWQPVRTLGGDNSEVTDQAGADGASREQKPLPEVSDRPVWTRLPFAQESLPNGLSEPVIEVVGLKDVRHLSYFWGEYQDVPFTARPTNIHQALSAPEFKHLPINSDLLNPKYWLSAVDPQMLNREGGGQMIFSMQRMTLAGAVKGEFNAIKVVELNAGELPGQLDAVQGYWAPQGGYVDIPVHPGWAEPDHVFTPTFSGCSFTVDQMGENVLRVRHVESGREAAQYNDLPAHEHGWGKSADMVFPDYGLGNDNNGNAYVVLTGFAFMKYDRTAGKWAIHYQSHYGAPVIHRFSKLDAGWFGDPTRIVRAYPEAHVVKTESIPVKTVVRQTQQSSTDAAIPA